MEMVEALEALHLLALMLMLMAAVLVEVAIRQIYLAGVVVVAEVLAVQVLLL
jgi:hypothetical protein